MSIYTKTMLEALKQIDIDVEDDFREVAKAEGIATGNVVPEGAPYPEDESGVPAVASADAAGRDRAQDAGQDVPETVRGEAIREGEAGGDVVAEGLRSKVQGLEEDLQDLSDCAEQDRESYNREIVGLQFQISNLMHTNQELRIENKKQAAELERYRASGVKYPS